MSAVFNVKIKILLLLVFFAPILLSSISLAQTQSGEELFSTKCAGCHTIGGGDTIGPDLLGVTEKRDTEWLVKIISEPEKLLEEKDPIMMKLVSKYGLVMPELGVSEEEALKILEYLKQFSPKVHKTNETPTNIELPKGNADIGKSIFIGEIKFKKGGAPCISCHSLKNLGIYGGTLSKDLSDVYNRLGEKALYNALKTLPFPVMRDIYTGKQLTDEEIYNLIALFKEASEVSKAPKIQEGFLTQSLYPTIPLGMLFIVMIFLSFYYWRVK